MKTISLQFNVYVVVAILAAGCGSGALVVQRTRVLDGKWKLAQVKCSGADSTFLPSNVLEAGIVSSQVDFEHQSGERIWQIPPGCTVKTGLAQIEYPADGVVRIADLATTCSGTCDGISACSAADKPASDYPFVLSERIWTVTLPADVKARETLPCGQGQSTDVIEFIYHQAE